MLSEIGCLNFDWATVGTWIGGIGSTAAAGIALWLAKNDERKRRKYAEFLFKRDVQTLYQVEPLLVKAAAAMEELGLFGHHLHPNADLLIVERDTGLQAIHGLLDRLEYFGRSERLFEYNPQTVEFANLEAAINAVLGIPTAIDYFMSVSDMMSASDAVHKLTKMLTEALKPYAQALSKEARIASSEPA